jgi:mono/diheme cytochrome c family protein
MNPTRTSHRARSALCRTGAALALLAAAYLPANAQMMGGGRGMSGMMYRQPTVNLPATVNPEHLPLADSPGASLFAEYCSQCHALPAPWLHTAPQWPWVVDRMYRYMLGRGRRMMGPAVPSPEQLRVLATYLQQASRQSHRPARNNEAGAVLFRQSCARCHALPSPQQHTAGEWPAVVRRMARYMAAAGGTPLSEEQMHGIVSYLQKYARDSEAGHTRQ